MNKTALIYGISGQDGSYLANFLLAKGYKVYGSSRDSENSIFSNLEKLGIKNKIKFVTTAVENFPNVSNIIKEFLPDEIYYLAGQSSVALSFKKPEEPLVILSNSSDSSSKLIVLKSFAFLFFSGAWV